MSRRPDSTKQINVVQEIAKLKEQLNNCCQREAQLDTEIESILAKNSNLPKQLDLAVSRAKTRLAVAESDARQLDSLLNLTSSIADDVSTKVRELDLCKSRVIDCLQRVEDALDLRLCTEGVRSAMANEDYEQAAGHVHRFLSLDNSIVGLSNLTLLSDEALADETHHPAESLEHQFSVMKSATNDLKQILATKFDEALNSRDVASMERFFKLFPLLGQHEWGLKKFGAYLKSQIAETARKNYDAMLAAGKETLPTNDQSRLSVIYSDSLTILVEGVARLFELHQPLVETYYGPEYLFSLAEILQEQCDEEATHILDQFVKVRQYSAKAKLIDSYSRLANKQVPVEKLDPLELDQMLSEVVLLQTRAELYFRFIKRRVVSSMQNAQKHEEPKDNKIKSEKMIKLEKLIRECRLNCRMQELIGRYIPMEEYYMRETVSKAVLLNATESSQTSGESGDGPLTSSLVDDVLYVIRKSVQRASSSSNVDCLCAVLNNACSLLETDFYQMLHQKLKNGYPAAGSLAEAYTTATAAYVSVVQQGKIPAPYGPDSAEKARSEFVISLNNIECSAECIRGLKEALSREHLTGTGDDAKRSTVNQDQEQKMAKLDGCLSQLVDLATKFDQLSISGAGQLATAAAKQRIKLITERFLDYNHAPDENQFNEYEVSDPFIEQFVFTLDSLLSGFKRQLTENNYKHFFEFVAEETARQLEKVVQKCDFNRLGALLLDKQVRELNAYYSAEQSGGGFAVREKFSRLTQLASIVNVDSVLEAKEFYQSTNVAWRLAPAEVKKILQARVDFSHDEIRKLKL